MVSILPFDVLSIVASKAFANLKIFRLFRLMRLIKLVRLIRASRMFKRWESRMSVSYGTLALIKSLVLVCIGAHWFACTWAIQAGLLFDSPLETWMGYQGYCVPVNISLLPESTQEDHAGYECADAWVMYTASLYFAVMTITSIGYGDIHATPQNAPEQGVALVTSALLPRAYAPTITSCTPFAPSSRPMLPFCTPQRPSAHRLHSSTDPHAHWRDGLGARHCHFRRRDS